MRIKKHENLTKQSIAKVISLLEQDKPITKKEACGILNITYNTTRLGNIIAEHKSDIERTAKMKARLRGTPASSNDSVLPHTDPMEVDPLELKTSLTTRKT